MRLILVYLLQFLAFATFYQVGVISNELLDILFVAINTAFIIAYIFRTFKSSSLTLIFILGFIFRIILLFLDLYSDISVIHSGSDTEDFHAYAQMNISSGAYLYHRTNYTKILTFIYSVTETSRLIAQYLNIVLAMATNILVLKILNLSNTEFRVKRLSALVLNFFPTYLIISSILLREMLVIFFMVYSIYYFIIWLNNLGVINLFRAIVLILISSYFHSGTVAILMLYLVIYILYKPSHNRIEITFRSLPSIFIASIILLIFILNMSVFGAKFMAVDEGSNAIDYINEFSEASRGGSAYLSWLKIENPLQLIIYSPLKIIYFLFSPIPIDWRSIQDVISFFLDSLFYLLVTLFLCAKFKILTLRTKLLLIITVATILLYSLGVSNTGTAIRHRSKVLPLVVLLYGFAKNDERRRIYSENN